MRFARYGTIVALVAVTVACGSDISTSFGGAFFGTERMDASDSLHVHRRRDRVDEGTQRQRVASTTLYSAPVG
jgi:hypothetical protein